MTPRSRKQYCITQAITGNGLADYDLSDDEHDALPYTLSMEEVRKVSQQQFIFSNVSATPKESLQQKRRPAKNPGSSGCSCHGVGENVL